VNAAALYLETARFSGASSRILDAISKWSRVDVDVWERKCVLKPLARALKDSGDPEGEQGVLELLKRSLTTDEALPGPDAVSLIEELSWEQATTALTEDLLRRLNAKTLDVTFAREIKALGHVWRPADLRSLANTWKQEEVAGNDLASALVNVLVNAGQESERPFLRDRDLIPSAVSLLAKACSAGFREVVVTLLGIDDWNLIGYLADMCWVAADQDFEDALLQRLAPSEYFDTLSPHWREDTRFHLMRALGTCGTTNGGAQAVLAYLREEKSIYEHFAEEGVEPLVLRGQLGEQQLVELATDNGASSQGRCMALDALARIDATKHVNLFLRIINESTDSLLLARAAICMQRTGPTADASSLIRLLTDTDSDFVAAAAALSLGHLRIRDGMQPVLDATRRFANASWVRELVRSLGLFPDPPPMNLVLNLLETVGPHSVEERAVVELLGHYWPHDEVRVAILSRLETWYGPGVDSGEQVAPIRALEHANPDFLLRRATELYDIGKLSNSALGELAWAVQESAENGRASSEVLASMLERLLCDEDFDVRDRCAAISGLMERSVVHGIYWSLISKGTWEQSCAVYSLGFWAIDARDIERECASQNSAVRRSARATKDIFVRREAGDVLVALFGANGGHDRLAAYFSISDQGDSATMRKMHVSYEESPLGMYLAELVKAVKSTGETLAQRRKSDEEAFVQTPSQKTIA
jgi:hypothetical protein